MTVFENIDNEIVRQKKSRRRVAMEAGIAPSTFQSIMERKRGMPYETLQKIAAALNVPIDSLDPVTAAKNDAIDVLTLKSINDKNIGIEWSMQDWYEKRKLQINETAKKYDVDPLVLDRAMPTAESISKMPSHGLVMCYDSNAYSAFNSLSDDWRKSAAVQIELDILKNHLGPSYNDKVFNALLNLFRRNDDSAEELARRLETLAYDPAVKSIDNSSDKK